MSKWYWTFETLKAIIYNWLCDDPKNRYWLISEPRLEHYQKISREYDIMNAERDMWCNIAQTNAQKLQCVVSHFNEEWRVRNEK